ncbi:MAG: response regulator transcription factor [Acidimicrobiales bacterium]
MALSHESPVAGSRLIDVLVVDDTPEFQQLLAGAVRHDGYRVHLAGNGSEALELLDEVQPDVVLLDLVLPGMDGLEVCRRIRAISDVYIIMVTAKATELDKVVGLAVGADDYLTKPFSAAELVARIGAMLRRPRMGIPLYDGAQRRFGALVIDPAAREVRFDGLDVGLTRIEFEILAALSERPGMVFSRSQLIEIVWGPNWVGDDHLVDVHIANLRKKIDRSGIRHIKTVRGIGYRMAVEAT